MGDVIGQVPAGRGYDPGVDAAARYPDWVVAHVPLAPGVPEVLSLRSRVILVDAQAPPSEQRCSLAHALAHLDLDHREPSDLRLEARQERAADLLAATRLIPLDALASVLAWSQDSREVAHELDVDIAMLAARVSALRPEERAVLGIH